MSKNVQEYKRFQSAVHFHHFCFVKRNYAEQTVSKFELKEAVKSCFWLRFWNSHFQEMKQKSTIFFDQEQCFPTSFFFFLIIGNSFSQVQISKDRN